MRRSFLSGSALLSTLAMLGCGSNDPPATSLEETGGDAADTGGIVIDTGPKDDTNISITTYTIEPINTVVKIDTASGTPVAGKQAFTVKANDGTTDTDVTDKTTFTLDDATLGSFGPGDKGNNLFTSTTSLPPGVFGKSTTVRASPGSIGAKITVIALRTSGPQKDFFFTVAYKKDPVPLKDILKFGTNIKQVDVGILMDTTASMGGEINNLKDTLSAPTTGIIASLKKAIPSVGVGIGRFDDFPVAPFGYDGTGAKDVPFELLTPITTTEAKAQSAVALLNPYRGGELPESQYEAQYQFLTGEGFTWTAGAGGKIDPHVPPAGTTGGANFRAGSLPVVVLITDASWFEKTVYDSGTTGKLSPHDKAAVVGAYDKLKAKFVGVHALIEKSGGGAATPCADAWNPSSGNYKNGACDSSQGFQQAIAMAQATKSELDPSAFAGCAAGKCCTGVGGAAIDPIGGKCPLVYTAKTDGTGVDKGIVSAIQAISIGSEFDVTAVPSNDPANALGDDGKPVDATKFIKNLRAMKEGDAGVGCPAATTKDTNGDGIDDTFVGVKVGTAVCFEVNAATNNTVPPKDDPQFFNAFIDVLGMPGSVKLDRRDVRFLVPPKDFIAAK
ncbi:MAG: hypothetical protein JNL79_26580 [Myxococcales bacterium]|nr:hypothetical protein [Myxococcales bacterium]